MDIVSNRPPPRPFIKVSPPESAIGNHPPVLSPPTQSSSDETSATSTSTGPVAASAISPVSLATPSTSMPKPAKQLSNKHALISTQVTKMIITDLLPLQIVEGEGFQELLRLFDPSYTGITQAQLQQSILPFYTKAVEEKIQGSLAEMESYVLTVDIWNVNTLTSYVGFSVSFFTPEWRTKTVLLTCSCITGCDQFQKIPSLLKQVLQEHNITIEPHCIVLNDRLPVAVNLLGNNEDNPVIKGSDEDGLSLVHAKSFSSLLSESIREGLINGLAHYRSVLDAVALLIAEIRKSREATEKVFGKEIEKSKTDVTWILHLMLIRCMLKFNADESAVNENNKVDLSMDTSNNAGLFTDHQQSILVEIVSILELFVEAVDMIETKSLPVSMCLPSSVGLKNHLSAKTNGVCSELAQSLLSSINGNVTAISRDPLYVCSAVLDPRFKLSWCAGSEGELENFKIIVLQEAQKIFDASNSSNTATVDERNGNNAIATSKLFSFISSQSTSDSKPNTLTPASELENYLKESLQDVHDPCSYWRARSGIYPTLYQLAKCCLCLPVLPTAISKVFLQSSSTLNEDLCYSLKSLENLETLLFLKASTVEFQLF